MLRTERFFLVGEHAGRLHAIFNGYRTSPRSLCCIIELSSTYRDESDLLKSCVSMQSEARRMFEGDNSYDYEFPLLGIPIV